MKKFLNVKDVMCRTGYGKSRSYELIKDLNAELEKRGIKTLPGRVSEGYFNSRFRIT